MLSQFSDETTSKKNETRLISVDGEGGVTFLDRAPITGGAALFARALERELS
ncbi:hypothetical protein [Saccharothrix stipae]